jgi:hypothetical protein
MQSQVSHSLFSHLPLPPLVILSLLPVPLFFSLFPLLFLPLLPLLSHHICLFPFFLPSSVSGVPACASSFLLQELLRNTWNSSAYTISDWGGVELASKYHHYFPNNVEAVAGSIQNGLQLIYDNEASASMLLSAVHHVRYSSLSSFFQYSPSCTRSSCSSFGLLGPSSRSFFLLAFFSASSSLFSLVSFLSTLCPFFPGFG